MAGYDLIVDNLFDALIRSDRAAVKYGGIVLKKGASFLQNGGLEKIGNGIDAVNDILDKVNETMDSIGQVIDSATENTGKAADFIKSANGLLGTFTPAITSSGPAIVTAVSPVGLVSSLGGNVQNAFIQKGVNKLQKGVVGIGKDVGQVKEELSSMSGQISELCGAMSKMNNLSWISAGASVFNCGISTAGFALVLNQMKDVQRRLDEIQAGIARIEQRLDKALIGRAKVVFNNLMHYMQGLSSGQFELRSSDSLVQNMNEAAQLVMELAGMAREKKLEVLLILQLLLPLNVSFEKVAKEYSIKAFYENGAWPVNLASWEQTLDLIGQMPVCDDINFFIHLEYPELSKRELSVCIRYIKNDLMQAPALELKNALAFIDQAAGYREAVLENREQMRVEDIIHTVENPEGNIEWIEEHSRYTLEEDRKKAEELEEIQNASIPTVRVLFLSEMMGCCIGMTIRKMRVAAVFLKKGSKRLK